MSVRNQLYLALIKELLGPRKDSKELMSDDPRNEFVTGILEPKGFVRAGPLEDYTKSDLTAYQSDEEFEEDRAERVDDFEVNPATSLDPRSFPKSMGLSFVIKSEKTPLIHFCTTWARYTKENTGWRRAPDKHIELNCDASVNQKSWNPAIGVRIVLRSVPMDDNRRHVSIYIVNETKIDSKILTTPYLLFQPEIRVKLVEGTLESIDERRVEGAEEKKLDLLYRKMPALARGHLCGALWKKIDPARPIGEQKKSFSPLLPEDIKVLTENEREFFEWPDLRTDYLPAYSVTQSITAASSMGFGPDEMGANILAEKWESDALRASLDRIPSSYRNWIAQQEAELAQLSKEHKTIAASNIEDCKSALERMIAGIEILTTNEDARLAFCFTNMVMDTQTMWTRRQHLEWRPFQIGFVLQCLRGIVNEDHIDRKYCDLLWFPTGGGKTEAYLGLIMFTLAFRSRKYRKRGIEGIGGAGTAVISRYTLRLLTIQQFRRTLNAITAAEFLRIRDWKPTGFQTSQKNLWGKSRFSIGLWVGSDVTPNNLVDHVGFDKARKMNTRFVGAIGILSNTHRDHPPGERTENPGGEPAQVMKCPSCSTLLAVPAAGYSAADYTMRWVIQTPSKPSIVAADLDFLNFRVTGVDVRSLPSPGFHVVSITFTSASAEIREETINQWWVQKVSMVLGVKRPASAYASRPGYFIRRLDDRYRTACDFEIRCPNQDCDLNKLEWFNIVPGSGTSEGHQKIIEPFRIPSKPNYSHGMPIPAMTVDAQIYSSCPSVIIATADKFARLPFEARSGSIFGNVNRFDMDWGFFREDILPDTGSSKTKPEKVAQIEPFMPPELIIQDELHLIEGPLGSLAGLYECAVDALATRYLGGKPVRPKYIASTATVRQAAPQVSSLYSREVKQFPPSGVSINDSYFSTITENHPLASDGPGRLYVGVCAPGKGPQTPTVRIWSRLLQQAEEVRRAQGGSVQGDLDYYWTLVGYFNAIRELAAAAGLYRQDIPGRLKEINLSNPTNARQIGITTSEELSSNINSMELPAILERIERTGDDIDAVLATSMFGTGVDINRLSLMVVHGQPKTTSSYIQATGRVGRQKGGLVVTFLRSTRPRDLAHYEFFTGYHQALQRYVEPVTVAPFSPRACDRALGPIAVAMLRNGISIENVAVDPAWAPEDSARLKNARSGSRLMGIKRNARELEAIANFLDGRAQGQPAGRQRPAGWVKKNLGSGFDLWENTVLRERSPLFYNEVTYSYDPEFPVVLGDAAHDRLGKSQVFERTPQSLREIESTARFEG